MYHECEMLRILGFFRFNNRSSYRDDQDIWGGHNVQCITCGSFDQHHWICPERIDSLGLTGLQPEIPNRDQQDRERTLMLTIMELVNTNVTILPRDIHTRLQRVLCTEIIYRCSLPGGWNVPRQQAYEREYRTGKSKRSSSQRDCNSNSSTNFN